MEEGLQLSLFDDSTGLLSYDNGWNRISEGERQEKLSQAGVI